MYVLTGIQTITSRVLWPFPYRFVCSIFKICTGREVKEVCTYHTVFDQKPLCATQRATLLRPRRSKSRNVLLMMHVYSREGKVGNELEEIFCTICFEKGGKKKFSFLVDKVILSQEKFQGGKGMKLFFWLVRKDFAQRKYYFHCSWFLFFCHILSRGGPKSGVLFLYIQCLIKKKTKRKGEEKEKEKRKAENGHYVPSRVDGRSLIEL